MRVPKLSRVAAPFPAYAAVDRTAPDPGIEIPV